MREFIVVSSFLLMLISADIVADNKTDEVENQFPKIHFSAGYGYSMTLATDDMLDAFFASGFDGTGGFITPVQFPYERSKKWTWNAEANYQWQARWRTALGVRAIPDNEVVGRGGFSIIERSEIEFANGTIYYMAVDYVIKSAYEPHRSKCEVSAGLGLSYSKFTINGTLGSYLQGQTLIESEPWELSENKIGGLVRTYFDYYFTKPISLQFRVSAYFIPSVDVPEQTFDIRTLEPHTINFSAFEMTLRLAVHI